MPINVVLQLFFILSFLLLLIITAKVYFIYKKNTDVTLDSIIISVFTVSLLYFPLLINSESRIILSKNIIDSFAWLLLGLFCCSVIVFIALKILNLNEKAFEKGKNKIFKKAGNEYYIDIILEQIEYEKPYTVEHINEITKIPIYQIESILNIMALDNKVNLSVMDNGELTYCINQTAI